MSNWKEAIEKAGSTEAGLREALRQIKALNDMRTHDALGYEVNDLLEAALALPPEPAGNAAAMREALTSDANMARARGAINDAISDCNAALSRKLGEAKDIHIHHVKQEVKKAWDCLDAFIRGVLDAPRRNCDVGTAEEQCKRMEEYCAAQHRKARWGTHMCSPCPFHGRENVCTVEWSQMPYKAEGVSQ